MSCQCNNALSSVRRTFLNSFTHLTQAEYQHVLGQINQAARAGKTSAHVITSHAVDTMLRAEGFDVRYDSLTHSTVVGGWSQGS